MANIDTRNLDATAGAVYFTVGRGTEGGSASYRLSVAGVSRGEWGQVSAVAANSGYSIGTIQVDLGQRGTWPLGSITNRPLNSGETTYVDAIIEQSSSYAKEQGMKFTEDVKQLRTDLLTHGDGAIRPGGKRRSSITFIDTDTRDSINAWASSDEGKRWIHANIDYPQVRNATEVAMSIVDTHGRNISEDRRFEAINILAKTANQYPNGLDKLELVLKNGGDYDALLGKAKSIQETISFYAGPKAARVAEAYENAYNDPDNTSALDRAHARVSKQDYDPSTESADLDVQRALDAVSGRPKPKVALGQEPEQGLPATTVGHALLADSPFHPDHAAFGHIHSWVRGTGQWDEDKSLNVASALYKAQVIDPLVKRVDQVTGALGKMGEENVFAVYAPFGEKGPFFQVHVDGREAAQLPAQQSLTQAEEIRQQFSQQQQVEQQQRLDQQMQRGP